MTLRVGFFGAGLIATYHSISLRRSGADVSWSAVHDPDPERAARFAAASGASVTDEEGVFAASDVVYVCTWTSEHRRLVQAAAERGLPVFCEKPLAVDLEGARAMASAVADARVVNQVGLVLRYSPAFVWARHLIDDERSGRIMAVVFRDDQYLPVQGMYGSSWRGDPARAGAGALIEHSIHDVDVLEWLAGPITSVTCATNEFHGIVGIEDVVSLSVTFASGALGTLMSVWHDVLERPSLRRVEVFCERMWLAIDGSDWLGPVQWTYRDEQPQSLEGDELVAQVRRASPLPENPDGAFIDAVERGSGAFPDMRVALRAHEVVDAAYRSAAAGSRPVATPILS